MVRVKFTLIYLVITFGEYWAHRLGHTWKWAWAGHKFHHAATEMTMINAYRNSPVGGLLPMVLVSIPVAIMGPSGVAPLAFFGSLIIIHNMLNHSNVNWSYGWVGKYLIASPRYHRIHHSTHEDHINKNYCDRIVLWDRVFNTYYDGDVEPVEFGFEGNTDNQSNVLKDLIDGAVETYVELCKVVLRK